MKSYLLNLIQVKVKIFRLKIKKQLNGKKIIFNEGGGLWFNKYYSSNKVSFSFKNKKFNKQN